MKTKKFSEAKRKKAKTRRDSLRGHEEVGVAVGEVADGQGDGAEQEEVHGVLCRFVFLGGGGGGRGGEREGEAEETFFDETTSKRKRRKSCAILSLVVLPSLSRLCICALLGLGPRPRPRDAQGRAFRDSATRRARNRRRKGAIRW